MSLLKSECAICKRERKSKNLVLNGNDDKRIEQDSFLRAPGVFANDDMKYEVNKLRAQLFAKTQGENITFVPAKVALVTTARSGKW